MSSRPSAARVDRRRRASELATPRRRPIPTPDSSAAGNDGAAAGRRVGGSLLALAVTLCVLSTLAVAGCRSGRARHGSGDVAVVQPLPIPTPAPEPMVTPVASPEPPAIESTALELADRAFDSGDYATARAGYQAHIDGGDALDADRVLYRLAVLDLAGDGGSRDAAAGYTLLRRLVREYPSSRYRMEAELILGLNAKVDGLETEVEKLERQLEALKRIDLERSQDRRSP